MSSHREAPEISKDPAADNTDVYAFVSPDKPDTVTLIANYLPFQSPQGGPNFYEFSDDVLYEIHISNGGDAKADVTYQFRFKTTIRNPNTFLYNTGPIANITDTAWNRPQTYSVSRMVWNQKPVVLASNLPVPPVNVGVRSTPELQEVGRPGDPPDQGWPQGVRRSARRGVLRGPGQHLRPRRTATVQPRAPDPVGRCQRSQRHWWAERALDRHPGPDHGPHPGWDQADQGCRRQVDDRRVGLGQPQGRVDPRRQRQDQLGRPLCPGVTAREPSVQRGHRADGPEGCVERRRSERRLGVHRAGQQARVGRPAAGALPGCVPQSGGVHEAPSGSECDPDDRNPDRCGRRFPELHRARRKRTCCGSMWPCHRRRAPIRSDWSRGMPPDSPTAAGCSTTSSLWSCVPLPVSPFRWWIRRSLRMPRRRPSRTAPPTPTGRTSSSSRTSRRRLVATRRCPERVQREFTFRPPVAAGRAGVPRGEPARRPRPGHAGDRYRHGGAHSERSRGARRSGDRDPPVWTRAQRRSTGWARHTATGITTITNITSTRRMSQSFRGRFRTATSSTVRSSPTSTRASTRCGCCPRGRRCRCMSAPAR